LKPHPPAPLQKWRGVPNFEGGLYNDITAFKFFELLHLITLFKYKHQGATSEKSSMSEPGFIGLMD